ncbi:MAG TPA: ABC transporter permease subunit [Streptosporangiaceae bacterium]|jgi:ABC-type transport system involved in multi-copper enzyme maturation permease subunit|nr:ABC transporter permease subunit [Streptosporangiaceae bacterium]
MTSATPAVPTATARAAGGESLPVRGTGWSNLLLAEWTKIRSVRSTVWTLLLFVIFTIGFTSLLTALTVANWSTSRRGGGAGHPAIVADPSGFVLGTGIFLGQLTICVLGVLLISSEYSSGVIRASLLAVPKRIPVLAAKAAVFAVLLLIVAEIVAFASFAIGSSLLHSKVPVSLSDQGVTRAVIGAGLYLTVLGLFALSIGGILRHTAGAITTTIGIILVLPILAGLLPGSWGAHINAYLPEQAGSLIYEAHTKSGALLSAWQGFGVLCLWTAVLLVIAAYLLKTRDA